jgi:hypothetical protein
MMSDVVAQFDLDQVLAGTPWPTSMLQWKTELEEFCRFMLTQNVRSFLEIGAGTGQLSVFLKQALRFDRVCACDLYKSPLLREHPEILFFHGDHHERDYRTWREHLGHIDMILIDADHHTGFREDYLIERQFPHRFIAFHDIANPHYPELCKFWEEEVTGRKQVFVNRDPQIPFGVPPLRYPFGQWTSQQQYESRYGRCCGLGVSWEED